jgi:hypothetical protein
MCTQFFKKFLLHLELNNMILISISLIAYFNLVIFLLLMDNTTVKTINDYFNFSNRVLVSANITALLISLSCYLFIKFI